MVGDATSYTPGSPGGHRVDYVLAPTGVMTHFSSRVRIEFGSRWRLSTRRDHEPIFVHVKLPLR
eukprot:5864189-Amphidinium_carterae.1